MIIVRLTAGLCNRMRVINSCLILAKKNKVTSISIIWEKNNYLNADFNDLFYPIDQLKFVDNIYIFNYTLIKNKKLFSSLNKISKLKYMFLSLFYSSYKFYDDKNIHKLRFREQYWDKGHKKSVFDTCEDFFQYSSSLNFYSLFKPKDNLAKSIISIRNIFSINTIGLHVRRTDHLLSHSFSTINLFFDEIEKYIRKSPDTTFYLATDDPKIQKELYSRYGSIIISNINKDYSRDSIEGIKDAVIDLFLLSNTRLIFGSYYSSFSDVASWIKNTPMKVIK